MAESNSLTRPYGVDLVVEEKTAIRVMRTTATDEATAAGTESGIGTEIGLRLSEASR
jgi:hypothetical protein